MAIQSLRLRLDSGVTTRASKKRSLGARFFGRAEGVCDASLFLARRPEAKASGYQPCPSGSCAEGGASPWWSIGVVGDWEECKLVVAPAASLRRYHPCEQEALARGPVLRQSGAPHRARCRALDGVPGVSDGVGEGSSDEAISKGIQGSWARIVVRCDHDFLYADFSILPRSVSAEVY